ncbi:phosphatidate cytidylyltransferase [Catalinimonas alkaloidigena]|uniref:Phosphatidate cytidylyltransferase n=1 Tax=Catalinimonas alkaloidigena TaxID=1075417 RepID=A0A1G9F517_9BACT|nr:phosphatidate cytidylyltransferase [Catalinimonas alkaloidigena]SDK83458.1 phosphatidate cytidylyltransferase [Catalinimonas alkaloidigena]
MRLRLSSLSNLQQRVIAAFVGALAIVNAIYWDEWSYFGLFFVLLAAAQLEFYKLLGLDGNIPLKSYGTFCGLLIYTLTFLVEQGTLSAVWYLLIPPVLSFIFLIKLYKIEAKPFTNIAFTYLGVAYVALPFALLNYAVFENGTYQYQIVLGSLFLLWASDTGAYFAGVNFGRRQLFARVSPKKSWEGSIGGLIAALLTATALATWFTQLPGWQWYCIALIIVVTGTYGDLVESLFKRSIAIKDSGTAIPGHGGFLDRFDGLLLASPFIAAFLNLL